VAGLHVPQFGGQEALEDLDNERALIGVDAAEPSNVAVGRRSGYF
jgi:hypothetical protein